MLVPPCPYDTTISRTLLPPGNSPRSPTSLPVLLATNLTIGLACVGNIMIVLGHPSAEWFHMLNPLRG